jgi:hypothetical protein
MITKEMEEPHTAPYLPTDASERKKVPLWSGLVRYFPDALVAVAKLSMKGNDQHNPGEPLHWSRGKSDDHQDTLLRHLLDSGTVDEDGHRHSTKAAWRALAILQLELEKAGEKQPPKELTPVRKDHTLVLGKS